MIAILRAFRMVRHLAVFFSCPSLLPRTQASKRTEFLICYVNHTLASRTQFTYAKLVCSYLYIFMLFGWFACERTMKTITMNVECCCCCCCSVRVYLPWRNHSTVQQRTHTHIRFSFSLFDCFSISRALFYVYSTHSHRRTCYVVTMKRTEWQIGSGIPNSHTHTRNTHTYTHETREREREASKKKRVNSKAIIANCVVETSAIKLLVAISHSFSKKTPVRKKLEVTQTINKISIEFRAN